MLNKLKFYAIAILPILSILFIATPAYASSTYTIYAYGSGYIMVGILKSVASVVASGGFSLILKSVVLIGFVIIFLQMIITSFKVSPHRSLVKYFAAVLVIYSALLIPKVNVNVYDTVNNTSSNAVVVSNVPWGIGAIASYFSQFQYYMTTHIEQAFSTPQTIDFTDAGMGFALTSQNMVDGVQIDDPYLFQSFTQYVYNCVLPGISAGALSSQALTQAGMSTTGTGYTTNSLLDYMSGYTSNAGANLLTTEYSSSDPSGVTTTCGAQTTDIQNDFNNYATNEAGPQIAGALGMTYATFANEYGLVNSSIYNMSSNAEDEIIQMMAVNQFNQAMIQSANLAGVNPSQLAYGSALAQQNMSDSFSISGQMAGKYMPVVYGIFSALFLAFSLFLIILMALPIGVSYLKMYVELGLFLAVWPALMAVYNYIMDLIIQQQFTYLAAQGYSLNSAHTVNTFIATQLGWMGYLSWGVPMMAYALVTGSTYAMVGAISSMDSAGKQASAKAAQQAASGNVNLGNDSLNNYNANKLNSENKGIIGQGGLEVINTTPFGQRSSLYAPGQYAKGGQATSVKNDMASNTATEGGVALTWAGQNGANSTTVTSVQTPNVSASSVNQKIATDSEAVKQSQSKVKTATDQISSTLQHMYGSDNSLGTSTIRSLETGAGADVTSALKSEMGKFAQRYKVSRATIAASLGFDPTIFGFKGAVDTSFEQSTASQAGYKSGFMKSLAHSDSFQSAIKKAEGATHNTVLKHSISDLSAQTESLNTSYSDMESAEKNLAEQRSLSEALSNNGVAQYLNNMATQMKAEGASTQQIRAAQSKFAYDFDNNKDGAQQKVEAFQSNQSGLNTKMDTIQSKDGKFKKLVGKKIKKGAVAAQTTYNKNKPSAGVLFNSKKYNDVKNRVKALSEIKNLRKQDAALKQERAKEAAELASQENQRFAGLKNNMVNWSAVNKDYNSASWRKAHPMGYKTVRDLHNAHGSGFGYKLSLAESKSMLKNGLIKPQYVNPKLKSLAKNILGITRTLDNNRQKLAKLSNGGVSSLNKNLPTGKSYVKQVGLSSIKQTTNKGNTNVGMAVAENLTAVLGLGLVGGGILASAEPEGESAIETLDLTKGYEINPNSASFVNDSEYGKGVSYQFGQTGSTTNIPANLMPTQTKTIDPEYGHGLGFTYPQ